VLGEAVDTPVKVTETPAGQDSVTDGVQRSYLHRGGETARVYWDSASALCGGVIQASDDNVDATVAFWHNGRS
jgi:hypothetical protein